MEGHLSSDQFMNVLSGRGSPEDQRHVEVCNQCAEKMARRRATLATFGESVKHWAAQKSGSVAPDSAFVRAPGVASPARFRFVLAAAAVLLAVMIPLFWHVPAGQRAPVPADDTLLFERIDAGVSRAVPKAMQSLVEPNDQPAQGETR